MKNSLRIIAALLFVFLLSFNQVSFAQAGECDTDGCPFGNGTQRPATAVSTTSAAFTSIATNLQPGDFSVCNVVSGTTYEWSLCPTDGGVAGYDAQMTLFTDTDVELCYSDDVCGLNPKIRYVATFSGTVKVQLNVYDCVTAGGSASTLVWRAVDPNLNDVEVAEVYTLSKMLIPNGNPHVVKAAIKNNGSQAVPFLEVALSVTGANTFSIYAVLTDLGPNETRVIEFEEFSSTTTGNNVITVTINEADDVPANNTKSVTQNANGTTFSYANGIVPFTGLGFNGATSANGEIGVKFTNTGSISVGQINVVFNAAGPAHRIKIYDATGPGGLPGDSLFSSAANRTATLGLNQIAISPAVNVTGDFWVIVVQKTTTFVNVGCENENPLRSGTFYFKASAAGAAWTDVSTLPTLPFRLMIEAVIACSPPSAPVAVTGAASVCPGSSNTYTVEPVAGATSYQWILPTGWTGTSTTTTMTAIAGNNGGNIGARAVSSCGPSSPRVLAVTTLPRPDAAFNYASGSFCTTGANPIPTSTTTGVYRAPAGVVFADSTTGEINLAASTPGSYTVTLFVRDGQTQCTNTATQNIVFSVCTKNLSKQSMSGIQVFPVPASNELYISSADDFTAGKVVLHALDGRSFETSVVAAKSNLLSINVGQIPRGLYKLQLVSDGKIWTTNIVLE